IQPNARASRARALGFDEDGPPSLLEAALRLADQEATPAASMAPKLKVPSQCHKPLESAETSAVAWKSWSDPVPPEKVNVPVPLARLSMTWPAAVLPDPHSTTMSLSSEPSPAAE